MARMIPSVISPEVKSTAEKRIFEWFRDAPDTDDWIVFHSLGISNHNRVIHGEVDFFVLVPRMGIFALEVKGGRVTRQDGMWSFTDKHGNTTTKERGPFDQAWDGVYSIVKDLKNKLDASHKSLEDTFYGIGVMFPDVEYDAVGCDEEQWQVFDSNDGKNVVNYIYRIFNGAKNRWKEVNHFDLPKERLPSADDCAYIASILRGDFDRAVAISVQLRYSEEELIRLTNEQYRCLDQLDDNRRCLITGGAGTGKTLIAIEEAKKAAAKGQKVALFCFNKNLGEWMEKYFEDVPSSLQPQYVGTFHRYMLREIKKSGISISYPRDESESTYFYSEDVPYAAKQAIWESGRKFDKIIVDEAQDLITTRYLNVFDACLAGGFTRGRWTLLGDFSGQAIYSSMTGDEMKEMLEERTAFVRFKLTINCRNTKMICKEVSRVTGFEMPSDVWSRVDGLPVDYYPYQDRAEEKAKLTALISSLLDNHVSAKKITILSPLKRESSIVSEIDDYQIKDYKTYSGNPLSFCTVQGFKGLENTIVILTDIESLEDKKLLYVALSRARSALYVFLSGQARQEYLSLLIREAQ